MNTLTAAERKRLTDYIANTGVAVLKTLESLSAEQLNFRPRYDRWSIAEVVEHLAAGQPARRSNHLTHAATQHAWS